MIRYIRIACEEIRQNWLCVAAFLIAIISSMPILFGNNFYYIRKVIFVISFVIYLCVLLKPKFIFKYFKCCS